MIGFELATGRLGPGEGARVEMVGTSRKAGSWGKVDGRPPGPWEIRGQPHTQSPLSFPCQVISERGYNIVCYAQWLPGSRHTEQTKEPLPPLPSRAGIHCECKCRGCWVPDVQRPMSALSTSTRLQGIPMGGPNERKPHRDT